MSANKKIETENQESLEKVIDAIRADCKKGKKKVPKRVEVVSGILNEMNLYQSERAEGSLHYELNDPDKYLAVEEKFKEILRDKNESKEQLIEQIVNLWLRNQVLKESVIHNMDSYSRVLEKLISVEEQILTGSKSRISKRADLSAEDNRRLLECFEEMEKSLKRPIIGSDLRKFIYIVTNRYPEQLYIQTSRLTPEEKSLSKEDRDLILEYKKEKRGKSWARPRLVNFFESRTGIKGTTKISSSLK